MPPPTIVPFMILVFLYMAEGKIGPFRLQYPSAVAAFLGDVTMESNKT